MAIGSCVPATPDGKSPSLQSLHEDLEYEEKELDIGEINFEAKTPKDGSWHDVETFLDNRVNSSGEVEVLVRYEGFGEEFDEWIIVKTGVRDRSIPLDPSECHLVAEGDLVMSFRQTEEEAQYFDAHVVHILRKPHEKCNCTCVFTVRYVTDNSEATTSFVNLCRRPEDSDD